MMVTTPRPKHRMLAEIIEMIHTASLVHDDVIDEADVRRGHPTVSKIWGNKVSSSSSCSHYSTFFFFFCYPLFSILFGLLFMMSSWRYWRATFYWRGRH